MPTLSLDLPEHAVKAASVDDLLACRALLRQGSLTFFAASLLLPRRVCDPASALYAFCRQADDLVDNRPAGSDGHGAIAQLRHRLRCAYQGRPLPSVADRALAYVVAEHRIPIALPEALVEGFEWDVHGREYETIEDVYAYAARVAGSVGAMMALLMGVRSAEGLARACDLGVAMQLSNIARDVGEDARMGRLYLPRAWLRQAGIDPGAWLVKPVFSPALGSVVARLLDTADMLYQRVDSGVMLLPRSCRPGINAARFLYAEIGHEVCRRGLDSVNQRAVVSPVHKARLLGNSVLWRAAQSPVQPSALAETQYLVDAGLTAAAPLSMDSERLAWWNWPGRIVWVIDLFERMGRQEQLG